MERVCYYEITFYAIWNWLYSFMHSVWFSFYQLITVLQKDIYLSINTTCSLPCFIYYCNILSSLTPSLHYIVNPISPATLFNSKGLIVYLEVAYWPRLKSQQKLWLIQTASMKELPFGTFIREAQNRITFGIRNGINLYIFLSYVKNCSGVSFKSSERGVVLQFDCREAEKRNCSLEKFVVKIRWQFSLAFIFFSTVFDLWTL